MNRPEKIVVVIEYGSRIIYQTSYNGKEIEDFIVNNEVILPEKVFIAISDCVYELENIRLEDCSRAIIILCTGNKNEEKKYYCEDLSADTLKWEM